MNTSSLRFRLTVLTGLMAFLLLLPAWAITVLLSRNFNYEHKSSVLTAVSREMVEEMDPLRTADGDFPEMMEEIHEAIRMTSERLIIIHLRGGQPVRRSHKGDPAWPPSSGSDWMVSVIPYHGDQLAIGLYYGDTLDRLNRLAVMLGLLALCCLGATSLSTWYLLGKVLSPIRKLSQQARAAESDPETRLTAPSSDTELVELVSTLNQFLSRLAQSSEMRSRFYSAASHELRTPLQAMSGHLELALNKERSAQEYRAALEEAREQANRLIRLTRDLLLLNRLETSQVEKHELDLADVCENVWSPLARRAKDRNLKVSMELGEGVLIQSNPSYLDSLCRNLFENAVKYTPSGGNIWIRAAQGFLCVENDSDPIEPQDFEKLCEPFFRPDSSRTNLSGGNGLGLPLVSAIAEHEGWNFELAQDSGRFKATLELS